MVFFVQWAIKCIVLYSLKLGRQHGYEQWTWLWTTSELWAEEKAHNTAIPVDTQVRFQFCVHFNDPILKKVYMDIKGVELVRSQS